MHVFLTGFMGAGKSTVGKALAELLGLEYVDLDSVIESREQARIAEIFANQGEEAFRRLETQALQALDDTRPAVVGTGGGIMSKPTNRQWMSSHGVSVWLDVPFEVLMTRLGEPDLGRRPLFQSEAQVRDLFERRLHEYGDSDLRIEVSSADSAEDVADLIREMLRVSECDI